MDRSTLPPSLLLTLAAVPLVLAFPPAVYPSVLPVVLLLAAPSLLHSVRSGFRPDPVPFWFLGGGLVLTTSFASTPSRAADALLLVLLYATLWGAGRRLGPDGGLRLRQLLVACGTLLAAYGLYQALFGLEASADAARVAGAAGEIEHRLRAGRSFGRFPLPSNQGIFLLLCLPLTLAALRDALVRPAGTAPRRGAAGLLIAAAAVQVGGFLATLSLGAGLAAVCGCAYLGLRRLPRVALAGAAALIVLGAALAFLLRPDLAGFDRPDHPVGLRLANWAVAVEMVRDHPAAGVGPGCFGVRYPGYMREGMNETQYAHSVPLQLVAEAGLWSLLPLLLALAALLRRAAREQDLARLLCAAAILAFAAGNLWDFHLYLPSLGVPFFLLVGNWYGESGERESSSLLGRGLAAGALAVLVVVAILGYRQDVLERSTRHALEDARLEQALRYAELWSGADPWNADAESVRADLLLSLGRETEALEAGREAVRRDPWTPFRRAALARYLLASGRRAAALAEMDRASRLFPLREKYARGRDALQKQLEGASKP